jgi:hypothetical protein
VTSKHTVPAMRELAKNVRAKAGQILREAETEAAELCAAADEIDADANAKEARQHQQFAGGQEPPVPCQSCGGALSRDELGWRHLDHAAANSCPGPNSPVPAAPTAPFDTVPEGEVAQP